MFFSNNYNVKLLHLLSKKKISNNQDNSRFREKNFKQWL